MLLYQSLATSLLPLLVILLFHQMIILILHLPLLSLVLLLLCVLLVPAARADDLMDREIDHLLDAVGSSSCIFGEWSIGDEIIFIHC